MRSLRLVPRINLPFLFAVAERRWCALDVFKLYAALYIATCKRQRFCEIVANFSMALRQK